MDLSFLHALHLNCMIIGTKIISLFLQIWKKKFFKFWGNLLVSLNHKDLGLTGTVAYYYCLMFV